MLFSFLSHSSSCHPPPLPHSCEWINAEGGSVGCMLLDTHRNVEKHMVTFRGSSILTFFSVSVVFLSSTLSRFLSLFSASSERDAGQSTLHSSFGKVSQPLPDQPRQPQPTPGMTSAHTGKPTHKHTHTQSTITFSDTKSILHSLCSQEKDKAMTEHRPTTS